MGEMADLEIENMERGSSKVLDKTTGKVLIVDNMMLMYTSFYNDVNRYEIIGNADDDEEDEFNDYGKSI